MDETERTRLEQLEERVETLEDDREEWLEKLANTVLKVFRRKISADPDLAPLVPEPNSEPEPELKPLTDEQREYFAIQKDPEPERDEGGEDSVDFHLARVLEGRLKATSGPTVDLSRYHAQAIVARLRSRPTEEAVEERLQEIRIFARTLQQDERESVMEQAQAIEYHVDMALESLRTTDTEEEDDGIR